MWSFHLKSSRIVTPRIFATLVLSNWKSGLDDQKDQMRVDYEEMKNLVESFVSSSKKVNDRFKLIGLSAYRLE